MVSGPHRDERTGRPPAGERETSVLDAVVTLVDSLLDDFDVVELLADLTEQCTALLDIASAGLLLGGADLRLRLITATSARTTDLELFQLQADEGPCLDCYRTGHAVSVADLSAAGDRWPAFTAAALGSGFASVHAVPMRAAGAVLGALGLFGTSPGPLDASDLLVGQTLAHVASVAIVQEHPPAPEAVGLHLNRVLSRQVVVEQTKGFVHDRLGVPLDRTEHLLRACARRRGQHLSEIAHELMSGSGPRAELEQALRATLRDDG